MIITAKFASVCPCCSGRITPGAKVEWNKGSKASHVACGTASASYSRVPVRGATFAGSASRGRWTGCRCGSIEDQPRDSDCASCQHDY